MISIKQSFANCSICKLLSAPSCILETNSEKNLKEVEVIFISENPGKDEIKKQIPLIGKAGKTFRKPFDKYIKNNFKWLLTNCVLCCTINKDGTTGNPDDETIELCKENCFNMIKVCSPKLIVIMGTSPMKAFGLGDSGITTKRGIVHKWNEYDVLLTVHPSFVNRSQTYLEKFESDIKLASEILGNTHIVKETKITTDKKSGVHYYKIPDKFYTPEYKLIDIQYLKYAKKVLYIFRDKNNNRIIHYENDDFIYYSSNNPKSDKLEKFDRLVQEKINYTNRYLIDPEVSYLGDQKISVKHSQDYYIKSEGEPELGQNILFTDIEIFSEEKIFPSAENADFPICMITNYITNQGFKTYVIDNKKLLKDNTASDIIKREDCEIEIFADEKSLLLKWIKDLKESDIDIITGWNCIGFDLFYIYNRLEKVGIPKNSLSKFNEVSLDGKEFYADIAGIIVLDQYLLYRIYTFTQKESYKLGYISEIEIGETKRDSGQYFSDLYRNDINKAIDYNIGDVDLLVKLENKLKHIQLHDTIRMICKTSFESTKGNFGLIDSLVTSFLKERNIACKNADVQPKEKIPGAFVKEPIKGIHKYIVDFDFTSLYPSLIQTYNIGINTFVMKFEDMSNAYTFIYDRENMPKEFNIIMDPLGSKELVTMNIKQLEDKINEEKLIYSISGCFFKNHENEISLYSEILGHLLDSRKEYKHKMFEEKQKGDKNLQDLYNIRQLVYKVLANSVYGVIANNAFRFYSSDLAKSITLGGQESIKTAILYGNEFVKKLNTGKYTPPKPLTIQEMYKDLSRETQYVITGDTDSLFVTLQTLTENIPTENVLEQIQKWCDEIQSFLNNDVITKLVSLHNIDLSYNKLELKNELIINRNIFLAKKRYVIHVIQQEGVTTDEVIFMGMELKRSDFPSYTKDCLRELIDILLREEKISPIRISNFVKSKEREFMDKIMNGDKSVARPVSFTKALDEYKKIPQGATSMQNWNVLEYHAFDPGSRGYSFKIFGVADDAPDKVRLKFVKNYMEKGLDITSIAIPSEEERLPPYYIVDMKSMLQFSWIDRYTQILSPLMKLSVH